MRPYVAEFGCNASLGAGFKPARHLDDARRDSRKLAHVALVGLDV